MVARKIDTGGGARHQDGDLRYRDTFQLPLTNSVNMGISILQNFLSKQHKYIRKIKFLKNLKLSGNFLEIPRL